MPDSPKPLGPAVDVRMSRDRDGRVRVTLDGEDFGFVPSSSYIAALHMLATAIRDRPGAKAPHVEPEQRAVVVRRRRGLSVPNIPGAPVGEEHLVRVKGRHG